MTFVIFYEKLLWNPLGEPPHRRRAAGRDGKDHLHHHAFLSGRCALVAVGFAGASAVVGEEMSKGLIKVDEGL